VRKEKTNKPEKVQAKEEIDKNEVKQIRLNEFLKTSTYDNFGFSRWVEISIYFERLLDTSLIEFAAFFYCSSGMCVYFST
jgi:hypothetical protein